MTSSIYFLLRAGCLILFLSLSSGCASIILAQMRGKMPQAEADEIALKVRWAGMVVGSTEAKNAHYDDSGRLIIEELHEEVGTPAAGISIDGKGIKIPKGGKSAVIAPEPK